MLPFIKQKAPEARKLFSPSLRGKGPGVRFEVVSKVNFLLSTFLPRYYIGNYL